MNELILKLGKPIKLKLDDFLKSLESNVSMVYYNLNTCISGTLYFSKI